MHQLIIIEKHSPFGLFWPNLIRDKRIAELSVEQILSKYQGFEGEPVCFFEIKENPDKWEAIIEEYLELKEIENCFILHVISSHKIMPAFWENQATKLGYDVGVCEEEKTIYSSIFHEILFGCLDELAIYKDLLNDNLLFPERPLAEKYVKLHDELSAQGKDVEDYEEMVIYEIWKHND